MGKKLTATILAVLFLMSALATSGLAFAEGEKELRILFTHDTHSSLLPYDEVQADGSVKSVSGYARLGSAIEKERNDSTVLVHAGDYSMGTFFNTIFTTHSPDLSLLGAMGYDAFTFGNHEFDFGPAALAKSLLAAAEESERLPVPICSNINIQFPSAPAAKELEAAFEEVGGRRAAIIEKNGVKIGIFGILSKGAASFTATAAPITFENDYVAAKGAVASLKKEGAEIIICLSHGGTNENKSKSEDNLLAKNVPGIDVIVSGHTHSTLSEPIVEGKTLIVSAGYNAKNLGELDVTIAADGIKLKKYALIPIDESLPENAGIAAKIEGYKAQVQSEYLDASGVKFDAVAAYSPFTFTATDVIDRNFGNYGLANLITDGYLNESKKHGIDSTISVINSGIIRSSFLKGDISEYDSYKTLSLGTGSDGTVGFPLVQFFITGEELRALCEVDVSVFPLMNEAQLFFSGVKYKYNPSRLIFNKVYDVEVANPDGSYSPLDKEKLYGVMGSLYLGQMAGLITDTSFGILKIEPKDSSGAVLADINDAILRDDSGKEVKEWLSLSHYLSSFEKNEAGVPQIPMSYQTARESKIEVRGLSNMLTNSTKFAVVVYIIAVALVLIIALIIVLIVRKLTRKKHRKGYVYRHR